MMSEPNLEARLLRDVEKARDTYRATLQELQRATDLLQGLEAHPDGALHLKVATRRFGEASEAYRRALRALSNHILSQPPGVAMAAHRGRPRRKRA